jgi:hypothetical protein
MTYGRRFIALVVPVLVAGCSSDVTGTREPSDLSLQRSATAPEVSADLVARGFAAAMRDPAIRLAVRDAMRASPLTEHKLLLDDFLATPTGVALTAAAADRLRITTDAFADALSQLPAMDFYVPSQIGRRTWKGGSSVRVGYLLDKRGERARAFDHSGAATRLVQGMATPGSATFVLQAAERTARRIGAQASVPGNAIEDPNDGTIGGSIVEYLPNGTTRETQLADIYTLSPGATTATGAPRMLGSKPAATRMFVPGPARMNPLPCYPDCGGGGGGGAPPDTTFLWEVEVISVCDNAQCGETNEFEWHTYHSANSGSTWTNRLDLRIVGIPSTWAGYFGFIAIFKAPMASNEMLQSDVVETDGITPSDHFTPSPRWHSWGPTHMIVEGDERCTPATPRYNGESPDCAAFPWREVQQSMFW